MKFNALPAVAWIALGFAALLVLAIVSVHFFQIQATVFMPMIWWLIDFAGLAIALSTWFIRASHSTTAQDIAARA